MKLLKRLTEACGTAGQEDEVKVILKAELKQICDKVSEDEMGNVIGVHAESEYVTSYLAQDLQKAGRTDRAAWFESRPPATELEAVKRACFWAKETSSFINARWYCSMNCS